MAVSFTQATVLAILAFTFTCSAQEAKLTRAQKLEIGKQLAKTFELPEFHHAAAKGFAKLGPAGLSIVERALREGTETESRGALWSLLAIKGRTDRILTQIEWMLAHREDVLDGNKIRTAVISYLRGVTPSNERAVDALWSMLDGPDHDLVVYSLVVGQGAREAIVHNIVRDLQSEDRRRVKRAIRMLATNARYRRPAPDDFVKAVEALFAGGPRDLAKIRQLSDSQDRMTKISAQQFLLIYRYIDDSLSAHEGAAKRLAQRTDAERAARRIRMLDFESLREQSVAQLVAMGSAAMPALRMAIADTNGRIAAGAAEALTRMSNPRARSILTAVLTDKTKTPAARVASMQFLAASMDKEPERFAAIRDRTDESEPIEVRIAAIRLLAQSTAHRHNVVNVLEKTLRTKSVAVAEYATTTLGTMARETDERIIMILTRQLQSPLPKIQRAAIFALIGKGAKVHLQRLRKRPDLDPTVKSALEIALSTRKKVLAGFLVADYSDNRIVQWDMQGNEVSAIEEIFGVWDAEILDNGNYLLTEFSVNRVSEVTPDRQTVWSFRDLKNPYDADRLPNGNTLIADTFGRRVIEVNKAGKIVWKYGKDVHPYDVDRLRNGNTLIADTHDDRVIEVDPTGKIVWEVKNVPNVHDADRLSNGNTLLTIRMLNEVREIDRAGKIVFQIKNLSSPSDADRLPDGRTVVAENGSVRIFDASGEQIWRKAITWAVEVSPVWTYQREAQKKAGGK